MNTDEHGYFLNEERSAKWNDVALFGKALPTQELSVFIRVHPCSSVFIRVLAFGLHNSLPCAP